MSEEQLPTAVVRLNYGNSPYGWTYHEDSEYGKKLDANREELVRREDIQEALRKVLQEIDQKPNHEIKHMTVKAALKRRFGDFKQEGDDG